MIPSNLFSIFCCIVWASVVIDYTRVTQIYVMIYGGGGGGAIALRQPYLSGGAKWKNLPDFSSFSWFSPFFPQFLANFSLSRVGTVPPWPPLGRGTKIWNRCQCNIPYFQNMEHLVSQRGEKWDYQKVSLLVTKLQKILYSFTKFHNIDANWYFNKKKWQFGMFDQNNWKTWSLWMTKSSLLIKKSKNIGYLHDSIILRAFGCGMNWKMGSQLTFLTCGHVPQYLYWTSKNNLHQKWA